MTTALEIDGLTEDDRKSLEAAEKSDRKQAQEDENRVHRERRMADDLVASLRIAGLGESEMALCHRWAGLGTPYGVTDEVRHAKGVLDRVPLPDKLGMVDKEQFWQQMGLYGKGHRGPDLGLWYDYHSLVENNGPPRSMLGRIGRKLGAHWLRFALDNWPTSDDLYRAARRSRDLKPGQKVSLGAIWYLVVDLERLKSGRNRTVGNVVAVNPEDVYDELKLYQQYIEVDAWCRDDEVLLQMLKRNRRAEGCDDCGVYSFESYGWVYRSGPYGSSHTCYRCWTFPFRNPDEEVEAPERKEWDLGPTEPEAGSFEYRWAVKHGMMWDEFLQVVRGQPAGFKPENKRLCPLRGRCGTRCAQDQVNGVRAFPLGSSEFESPGPNGCLKHQQILWSEENGLGQEAFMEMKRKQWDQEIKAGRRPRSENRSQTALPDDPVLPQTSQLKLM